MNRRRFVGLTVAAGAGAMTTRARALGVRSVPSAPKVAEVPVSAEASFAAMPEEEELAKL